MSVSLRTLLPSLLLLTLLEASVATVSERSRLFAVEVVVESGVAMKPQYIKSGFVPGGPEIIPGSDGGGGGACKLLLTDAEAFVGTLVVFSTC